MGKKFIVLRTIITSEVCDLDNYEGMTLEEAKKYEEDMHLADYVESGALSVGDPKLISTAMNPWNNQEQYGLQDAMSSLIAERFGEAVEGSIQAIKNDSSEADEGQTERPA